MYTMYIFPEQLSSAPIQIEVFCAYAEKVFKAICVIDRGL